MIGLVVIYQRFGGTLCLYHHSSTFQMEAKEFSETLDGYQTIWHNILEDRCINRRENLKSHNKSPFSVK
jgi:hypothetical protein